MNHITHLAIVAATTRDVLAIIITCESSACVVQNMAYILGASQMSRMSSASTTGSRSKLASLGLVEPCIMHPSEVYKGSQGPTAAPLLNMPHVCISSDHTFGDHCHTMTAIARVAKHMMIVLQVSLSP